ncbi:hypothetical protein [Rhodococcus globerulus]|uniref:DUF3263 domain-containing protein n=1 Tax=Rhodococcus globerulus TaxID=33008 RepID=A0ABU4C4N8_RHOGO|nr:hypothetical protein [Rhodococcus globerulus]MDV6271483.1 hypothetical protein [Rhodococcus globerulus]
MTPDAVDIVRFALIWEPYGGARQEEIFVKFGISRRRFGEMLSQAVEEANFDEAVVARLRRMYAR